MHNISIIAVRLRAVFHRYIATNLHTVAPTESDTPIYDQLEREWASRLYR
jgi:hypothetical protein